VIYTMLRQFLICSFSVMKRTVTQINTQARVPIKQFPGSPAWLEHRTIQTMYILRNY